MPNVLPVYKRYADRRMARKLGDKKLEHLNINAAFGV